MNPHNNPSKISFYFYFSKTNLSHFYSNNSHDIWSILSIRILRIFVCQNYYRICFVNLLKIFFLNVLYIIIFYILWKLITWILSRSSPHIREPWKYLTFGLLFLRKPSNSNSGSSGCRKIASTSSSFLSSWWKSLRKLATVSKVMCPEI